MYTLEQKVDIVLRYITTNDLEELGRLHDMAEEALAQSSNHIVEQTEMTEIIAEMLKEIGIPRHYTGHKFLIHAINLASQDNTYLDRNVTKKLYPKVAATFNTTPSAVERNMRTAINYVFLCGDSEIIEEYFGNTIPLDKGHVTNNEFIAVCADEARRKMTAKRKEFVA